MYSVYYKNALVGVTELEHADPPMGFVHGILKVSRQYLTNKNAIMSHMNEVNIKNSSTNESLPFESVTIDDFSDELDNESIEITVLMRTSEDFEKYFQHHSEAYEAKFKQ